MKVIDPKPVTWLKEDRVWKWKLGKWQIRFEQWFCRITVIPSMWIDWEGGMISVGFTILPWCICFDFEFDPDYDVSVHETEYPI